VTVDVTALGSLFAIGVGDPSSGVLAQEVNDFDNVQIKFHLYDGDSIAFGMSALAPAAPYLSGLASDVFLYNRLDATRTDHLWQRFRVMPVEQTWGEDNLVRITAVCYKQALKGRLLHNGDAVHPWVFVGVDEATIAAELINHTQSLGAGYDLGIYTAGVSATGQPRDRTEYKAGDNIYKLLDDLSKVQDGPVWAVKPSATQTRALSVRKLSSFPVREMPLVSGDNAGQMVRKPATFANAAFVPGTNATVPAFYTTPEAATDPRGIWETSVSPSTSVTQQASIDALAQGTAEEMQRAPADWTAEVDVSRWLTDSSFMPGDVVTIKVPRAVIDPPTAEAATTATARVVEVELTVANTGAAAVKIALEGLVGT
jgi:hypothetical protein